MNKLILIGALIWSPYLFSIEKGKKLNTSALVKKIEALKETKLPDEWFFTKDYPSLSKKIEVVAEKMSEMSLEDYPMNDRIKDLKDSFKSKNALKYTVHYNKPISVSIKESDFTLTVFSLKSDHYVTIKGIDFYEAKYKKKEFKEDILKSLKIILKN